MFHFTKSGKEKEALKNFLRGAGEPIAEAVMLLSIFHSNKRNREKFKKECFNALHELAGYGKGRRLKYETVFKCLSEGITLEYVEAKMPVLASGYPNPSCPASTAVHHAVTAYLRWLAVVFENFDHLDKKECFNCLSELTDELF